MSTFDQHEREIVPMRQAVEVVALRRNTEQAAAKLRESLPVVLAGILNEVPGAELELALLTDHDGMVDIGLTASAGPATELVIAELSAALQPVAETVVRPSVPPAPADEWPVVANAHKGLGFVGESTQSAVASVCWRADEDTTAADVVEELACIPGHGLRVRLRGARSAPPMWTAELAVVTPDGQQPSLRMRAAVRRRFPSLQVAASCDEVPALLHVRVDELPRVFAFPVAGTQPLRGTYTGPAAPIAVARQTLRRDTIRARGADWIRRHRRRPARTCRTDDARASPPRTRSGPDWHRQVLGAGRFGTRLGRAWRGRPDRRPSRAAV